MVFVLRFFPSDLSFEPSSDIIANMGSAFSCGKDNDSLVNIFKIYNYISTPMVERVFRAVDRGDYIYESHRELAYQDMSCKVGNIHLSAPCIYFQVMEGLSLKPGQSFLNIGSGTGYLSTMAGLILGDNGTNHGIEMHEDCLIYAQEHLEKFKRQSLNVDVFEFCEPVFQLGNFMNVVPNREYDRVYCGAACPELYEKFVKRFVKIGGILVVPYKDHLLTAKRTGEKTWTYRTMLPVSFAPLMIPHGEDDRSHSIELPLWKPRSLQELCRSAIRNRLRKIVWSEHNDLEIKKPIKFNRPLSVGHRSSDQDARPFTDVRSVLDQRRESTRTMSTLQLVMNLTMQAIIAEGPQGLYGEESRPRANADSDEDTESLQLARHEWDTSMDEETEDGEDTKEARVASTTEQETSEEGEKEAEPRKNGRQADSSRSSSTNEDSNEEPDTLESMSDEDDGDTGERIDLGSTSESEIQDSTSSFDSDTEVRQSRELLARIISSATQLDNSASSNGRSEGIAAKLRFLAGLEESDSSDDENTCTRKTTMNEDKKDRTIDTDSSETSNETKLSPEKEEETHERTYYRKDYRAGQKRRSEGKSSGGNEGSSRVKKTHRSDSNTLNIKASSVNDGDTLAKAKSPLLSFAATSADNSTDKAESDSDSDLETSARKPKIPQIYGHTIRKDLFSVYMRKKILMLPLPPPLRLYVNYDREL